MAARSARTAASAPRAGAPASQPAATASAAHAQPTSRMMLRTTANCEAPALLRDVAAPKLAPSATAPTVLHAGRSSSRTAAKDRCSSQRSASRTARPRRAAGRTRYALAYLGRRRGWDSNPRALRPAGFKTASRLGAWHVALRIPRDKNFEAFVPTRQLTRCERRATSPGKVSACSGIHLEGAVAV